MQIKNKFIDDIAKTATGLAGSLTNAKGEVDTLLKTQLERLLADMDMISREEFETVKKMAQKAREENELLQQELQTLKKGK